MKRILYPILYPILYQGIFIILSWFCLSATAFAIAEVKSSVVIQTPTITLGDLLEDLDIGHDIWVMNSPAPGHKTTLSTRYLASLTKQHDVYWQNSRGVRYITISRKGKTIKHTELKDLFMQKMTDLKLSKRTSGIVIDNKNASLNIPEDSSLDDITVVQFNFDRRTKKFSAVVSYPTGQEKYATTTVRGRTHSISYVPTLNKDILAGHIITQNDIEYISMPTNRIDRNTIQNKSQMIGLTPRRQINSSRPLRLSDLERPEIVSRGKLVSILFKSGKISLTVIGKAIENGGHGDVIRVMNNKSHKTLDAIVIGPSQVQVVTAQNNLAQLIVQR